MNEVKAPMNGRTWVLNSVLYSKDISARARLLYMVIKGHMCGIADKSRNKYIDTIGGVDYFTLQGVSVTQLAEEAGISHNNVKKYLDELSSHGVLVYVPGSKFGSKGKTSLYYIPVSEQEISGQGMEDEVIRAKTGGTRREDKSETKAAPKASKPVQAPVAPKTDSKPVQKSAEKPVERPVQQSGQQSATRVEAKEAAKSHKRGLRRVRNMNSTAAGQDLEVKSAEPVQKPVERPAQKPVKTSTPIQGKEKVASNDFSKAVNATSSQSGHVNGYPSHNDHIADLKNQRALKPGYDPKREWVHKGFRVSIVKPLRLQ